MKKLLKGFGIIFCIAGIIVYMAMALTGDFSEYPSVRPLLIFMAILMGFFLYLLLRKKKVHQHQEMITEQPAQPPASRPRFDRGNDSTLSIADQFFLAHSTKLQSMERLTATPKISDYGDVDAYREAYEIALHALNKLRAYCSRYPGGTEWFEEMYEHCSNSRNPDFSLAKQIEEGYNDLIENYEQYSRRFKAKQTKGEPQTDASKGLPMPIHPTSSKLSEINISQRIPDDIIKLLWFSNGPFQNYFPNSTFQDFQVAGYTIHIQTTMTSEPSAIDMELPVALGFPDPTPLGYYPSYQNLTPEQRTAYLNWLSDITAPIDIGYVFIFYYGLERHLFFGNSEAAAAAIFILRELHQQNSFLSYSSDALMLYALINSRPDIAHRIITQKTSEDLRLLVSALCQHALSAQDIMRSHKSFSFENNRYIKAEPDLFLSTLEDVLTERYGVNSFPIQLDDFTGASCQLTLALANYSLLPAQRFVNLPDISTAPHVQEAIHTILVETHETVKIRLREARKKDHSSKK